MSGSSSSEELPEDDRFYLDQIRQRPSRLNAQPMRQVINRLMARRGYGQVQAAEGIATWWAEVVGPELAASTRPGRVQRGKLIVEVEDACTRQALHFEESRILDGLRQRAPGLKIRGLDLRG